MKVSERISLIVLIAFFVVGMLIIVTVPFSREIAAYFLVIDLWIFLLGILPIGIYGVVALILDVAFGIKLP